jgi:hypothetical protein
MASGEVEISGGGAKDVDSMERWTFGVSLDWSGTIEVIGADGIVDGG